MAGFYTRGWRGVLVQIGDQVRAQLQTVTGSGPQAAAVRCLIRAVADKFYTEAQRQDGERTDPKLHLLTSEPPPVPTPPPDDEA